MASLHFASFALDTPIKNTFIHVADLDVEPTRRGASVPPGFRARDEALRGQQLFLGLGLREPAEQRSEPGLQDAAEPYCRGAVRAELKKRRPSRLQRNLYRKFIGQLEHHLLDAPQTFDFDAIEVPDDVASCCPETKRYLREKAIRRLRQMQAELLGAGGCEDVTGSEDDAAGVLRPILCSL